MGATIKQIAELVGVHHSTISRALNNSSDISVKTREKILETAQRLNYHPNAVARSLVLGKTHCLGIAVPHYNFLKGYISGSILAGIGEIAQDNGYSLHWAATYGIERQAEAVSNYIKQRNVDGILLFAGFIDKDTEYILSNTAFPVVLTNVYCKKKNIFSISSANMDGGFQATEHFINNGHRRIGIMIRGHYQSAEERLAGYKLALKKHDMPIMPELIKEKVDIGDINHPQAINELLNLDNRPTAIFVTEDKLALKVIEIAQQRGITVPEDLSVIGFDDEPNMDKVKPSLSTVRQNGPEIGKQAAFMVLDIITGKKVENPQQKIKTELVVRESTGKLL